MVFSDYDHQLNAVHGLHVVFTYLRILALSLD